MPHTATENTGAEIGTKKFIGTPPPEAGHEDVGAWVHQNFGVAKRDSERLGWKKKWLRNNELIRGKHFRQQQHGMGGTGKYPLVTVNLFFVAHTTTVANLTDNKPKFDIVPHDDASKAVAPIMHKAGSNWWHRTKQQATLTATVRQNEKYGSTIEKMSFNPELEGGRGDADCDIVDVFKFLPWPGHTDIQSMPRLFEFDYMALESIRRLWPDTGKDVKPEDPHSALLGKEREEIKAGSMSHGRHTGNLPNNYSFGGGASNKEQDIQKALVVECWCKDYTMEPVMETRPVTIPDGTGNLLPIIENGQPVLEKVDTGEEKPKYPGFIRVIHVTNGGKIVLSDNPNPSINPNIPPEIAQNSYLWDKYPYIKGDSYSDETNFWGYSLVEQIENLVLEINKKMSQISAFIDKTVRPTLIMPKTAGVPADKISNLSGQKFEPLNHIVSQYIRYLDMPGLPPDFYKYVEMLLKLVDIISGIHDVTEGRKPAGVSAASAIVALQEKAETIFREKIRNLDLIIEERGRMWISLAQNWYTNPRKLNMAGADAKKLGEFIDFTGADFKGEFAFEVVTGSTMPKSVFVRREHAIQLFQSGALDQRALLESFDWPKLEEVIQRMAQGPLGQLLERLQGAGMDQPVLQFIQNVGSMDDNDYKQQFQANPTPYGGATLGPTQAGE